jgi:hypothetical protein
LQAPAERHNNRKREKGVSLAPAERHPNKKMSGVFQAPAERHHNSDIIIGIIIEKNISKNKKPIRVTLL